MSDADGAGGGPGFERGALDALVVGGGVAGLTAGMFTARAGLDTLVVNHGESILRRNAHLENFPGFPAGVNPRLFADMLDAQATRNGCERVDARVTDLRRVGGAARSASSDRTAPRSGDGDDGEAGEAGDGEAGATFLARTDGGEEYAARRVIAASWADASYLDDLGVDGRSAGSKRFVEADGEGRTNVEGLYAAGRLAEGYHQAVVSAGHGATAGLSAIHDSETPFYNDWVATEGYFTDRGREVPPGCEEIDETERRARERESLAAMREYFDEPHPDEQRTHPSLDGE